MRVPNYILTDDVAVSSPGKLNDTKTLPKGAFVKPLDLSYVPKHIIDDSTNRYFNEKLEVFCYTRFGVVAIPRNKIREV